MIRKLCVGLVATLAFSGWVLAASPSLKTGADKPAGIVVDLFDGMKQGDIEVKVIPKDSTEANVTIKNKTGKPLKRRAQSARMPRGMA